MPNDQLSPQKTTDKNFADFIAGGIAGASAGVLVAPLEVLKVHQQALPHTSTTGNLTRYFSVKSLPSAIKGIPSAVQNYFTPELRWNMIKAIPNFSMMFAGVCALEFSVNASVKERYGNIAGFTASAVTGAAFLSCADQFLYRRHLGQSPSDAFKDIRQYGIGRLFTGFQPMFGREFCFVTSMLGVGPAIAKQLHNDEKTSPTEIENWAGQTIAGLTTNTISHPFDALTRKMQIAFQENPSKKQSFFKTAADTLKNDRRFLSKGLAPRLALATYGQAVATAAFRAFRPKLETERNDLAATSTAVSLKKR